MHSICTWVTANPRCKRIRRKLVICLFPQSLSALPTALLCCRLPLVFGEPFFDVAQSHGLAGSPPILVILLASKLNVAACGRLRASQARQLLGTGVTSGLKNKVMVRVCRKAEEDRVPIALVTLQVANRSNPHDNRGVQSR